jgi:hypothetical protein
MRPSLIRRATGIAAWSVVLAAAAFLLRAHLRPGLVINFLGAVFLC